jgi:hypothetical protein
MESRKGIGGRMPGLIDYRHIEYNQKEYTVGTLTFNGNDIHFVIDKEDFPLIENRSWHYASGKYISNGIIHDNKRKELYIHNLVMNRLEHPGKGVAETVDHINNNGLDTYELYFNTSKAVINVAEEISFVQKLKPHLKDTLEVYFAGGEIIITPEHYECLDYWIENNMNEEIELSYTTNLSTLKGYKDKNLIEYWKKFPKLQIYASIDAEGDVAEIIRKGTDWKKIIENIKIIKEQVPHAQFEFTPTISIWNIFNFHILFDFLVNEKLIDYKTANPRFNLATNPWYANIMILPSHIKHRLVKLYEGYVDKYHSVNPNLTNGFLTIIHNLKTGSENKEGILEFKKNNDQYDAYRKEKLEDIIPELKEVYEWAEN